MDELTKIDRGYRVRETAAYYVDVIWVTDSWRLVLTPKDAPQTSARGWCYFGPGPAVMLAAVAAAKIWDPETETDPHGWNKNLQTGEHRFQCPECQRVTRNVSDVRNGYCGHCHAFTGRGVI